MDKKINLEFDYMLKDKVVAHVTVYSDGTITNELFTDDCMDNPLPFGNNSDSLSHFLESRSLPKARAGINENLACIDLKRYAALDIVHKTHGVLYDDFYWIRFKGESLSFNDIKQRE